MPSDSQIAQNHSEVTHRAALLLQRELLRFERLRRDELKPANDSEREWMLAMIKTHRDVLQSIEETIKGR